MLCPGERQAACDEPWRGDPFRGAARGWKGAQAARALREGDVAEGSRVQRRGRRRRRDTRVDVWGPTRAAEFLGRRPLELSHCPRRARGAGVPGADNQQTCPRAQSHRKRHWGSPFKCLRNASCYLILKLSPAPWGLVLLGSFFSAHFLKWAIERMQTLLGVRGPLPCFCHFSWQRRVLSPAVRSAARLGLVLPARASPLSQGHRRRSERRRLPPSGAF